MIVITQNNQHQQVLKDVGVEVLYTFDLQFYLTEFLGGKNLSFVGLYLEGRGGAGSTCLRDDIRCGETFAVDFEGNADHTEEWQPEFFWS